MKLRRLAVPIIFTVLLACLPDARADGGRSGSRRARNPVKASARRATAREALRRTTTRARPRSEPRTPEGKLREELHAIWAGRVLRRGVTAVLVVDARTGDHIYSVHEDDQLNPASNVKLVSTATVLDLMGPEWQYVTRLLGPAPSDKGVVRGDVYLRGNADPTLSRTGLEALAADVARSGVKRIEGNVLLSDDVLRDTVDEPRIAIRVRAGARPGAPAIVSVDPGDSFVQVHVSAVTTSARRGRLEISAQPIADAGAKESGEAPAEAASQVRNGPRVLVRVSGTIRLGKSGTYWRNLGMRSTFTGYAMRHALRAAGVEVTGGIRLVEFYGYHSEALAAGYLPIELGRHASRSMQDLVARVNKRSLNWLADRLLMTAGAEASGGGAPSMEHGLEAMYRWLERSGVDRKKVVVDTGSGLSHKTKITARQLVRVLRAAAGYKDKDKDKERSRGLLDPALYLASLAIGGVDGTLRGRFRGEALRGRVLGKTGTLRDSVALSGFISGDGDRALCFAIVTNGNRWNARARIRREHEQMVAAMKRYLDTRAEQDGSRQASADEGEDKDEGNDKGEGKAKDEAPASDDGAARAAEQAAKAAKLSKPLTGEGERETSDDAEAAEERQGSETVAGVSEDEQDDDEDESGGEEGGEPADPPPVSTP